MAFDPETVNSYELGWKGTAMDHRLNWALSTFYADYKDVQIPASVPCTVIANGVPIASFCGLTSNAGKAVFKGVEFEGSFRAAENIAAPSDRLNSIYVGWLPRCQVQEFMSIVAYREDGTPIVPTPTSPAGGQFGGLPQGAEHAEVDPQRHADYDVPVGAGRLNFNTTVSYRSSSQQFEIAIPGLDQGGFALWDANLVWRAPGQPLGAWACTARTCSTSTTSWAGTITSSRTPTRVSSSSRTASRGLSSAVGLEGTLTAFYGNPRQVFVSAGMRF